MRPMLDSDGITVLLPFHGQTADGTFYDGAQRIGPDDPRYDALIDEARKNPRPAASPQAGAKHETTAARLRELKARGKQS